MAEISHGGPQQHVPGQGVPGEFSDPSLQTKSTGNSQNVTENKYAQKSEKGNQLQQDSVATAQAVTKEYNKEEIKVTGFAWATMSQAEIDRAAPGDPRLGAHTGRFVNVPGSRTTSQTATQTAVHVPADNFLLSGDTTAHVAGKGAIPGTKLPVEVEGRIGNKPPEGPEGTGNPFFNPNPMTAFFIGFFSVLQLMKWNNVVATKMASEEMNVMMETAKADAAATIKAGNAAADGLIKQAIVHGVMAGVGVASLAMTAGTALKAAKTLKQQEGLVQQKTTQAKNQLDAFQHGTEPTSGTWCKNTQTDQLGNVRGMNKYMKELENEKLNRAAAKSPRPEDYGEVIDQQTGQTVKSLKKNQQQTQQELQQDWNDRRIQQKGEFDPLDPEIPQPGQPLPVKSEAHLAQQKGYDNISKGKAVKDMSADELDDAIRKTDFEIRKDQRIYSKQADELRDLQKAHQTAMHEEQDFYTRKPLTLSNLRQADPMYMAFQATKEITENLTRSVGNIFQAQAEREKAFWEAESKILGTQTQIFSKGMDFMFEMKRDSDQNTDAIVQLLMKLSDTEQSGMRWSA